ncbi:MAG: HAMP domain-containing histidine kinase [Desulfobulbaceae bacterium]|nr:MAG: HAMP domain-containing histidine kinase [Desulfobulbaceae bacterium]
MIIKQRKLFWQIFPVSLAIILISIVAVSWYYSKTVDQFYLDESTADLVSKANLIKSRVTEHLEHEDLESLQAFCIESGRASGTRITVIDRDGVVLADTKENPAVMDNHRGRPEINKAFDGTPGSSVRFSNTLGERLLYSAIPLTRGDEVYAVLRLSVPVTSIDSALESLNVKTFGGAMVAALFALLVTLFVSQNISRPLEEMTKSAVKYAKGNFSGRMTMRKVTASREVATLAAAMDKMADQLDEKINTIINQRNQLETVFGSMVEAVIAVDQDERIVSINEAAAELFGVDRRTVQAKLVQETIRNSAIHQQISHVLASEENLEDEIVISDTSGDTYLQTNAVSLYNGDGEIIGVLIVLNDVTRLRRLEKVRSDFVANVSHELRTPITSIRGYVETLLDGALEDRDDAERFLEIVLRQSEQLSEIIDDLLILSRVEQNAQDGDMGFEMQPLLPVLEEALQTCQHRAEQQDISLQIDCSAELSWRINRTLFEQAIVNLLVNAITYSEKNSAVKVVAEPGPGENQIVISVIDEGIGIAREHLPRLFERFYRSDKARSRAYGGTGLGLSIVKHIVQAHKGEVKVKSKLGEGSQFIITLGV